ncbi:MULTISPECIES: DUF1031 family protein [Lactococcus]|uniref:DUF1031 family protein n=1 Tax=Lactococcus TaxID=1357 RepID=UPI0024351C20|nr:MULTISPECIES: DUF1031 family protein [Lactococcus]MDG6152649.1 DUF1031 domain-containing protein [Lactococcus formosensis]MDG6173848.1 DUF1031 domain-containing protein [Lactococcus formosensis]MDG6181037.1 DUF1031 domain-containing protein [Lactococcus formosensis]MDG6184378.1 DUF1031 domain-containing protein [Lactococcus formosensis]
MASYTSKLFKRLLLISRQRTRDGFGKQQVFIEGKDKEALREIYKAVYKHSNNGEYMTWEMLNYTLEKKLEGNKYIFD